MKNSICVKKFSPREYKFQIPKKCLFILEMAGRYLDQWGGDEALWKCPRSIWTTPIFKVYLSLTTKRLPGASGTSLLYNAGCIAAPQLRCRAYILVSYPFWRSIYMYTFLRGPFALHLNGHSCFEMEEPLSREWAMSRLEWLAGSSPNVRIRGLFLCFISFIYLVYCFWAFNTSHENTIKLNYFDGSIKNSLMKSLIMSSCKLMM